MHIPPNDDDELPKAGTLELPNAGCEDEAPKVVADEKGEDD